MKKQREFMSGGPLRFINIGLIIFIIVVVVALAIFLLSSSKEVRFFDKIGFFNYCEGKGHTVPKVRPKRDFWHVSQGSQFVIEFNGFPSGDSKIQLWAIVNDKGGYVKVDRVWVKAISTTRTETVFGQYKPFSIVGGDIGLVEIAVKIYEQYWRDK